MVLPCFFILLWAMCKNTGETPEYIKTIKYINKHTMQPLTAISPIDGRYRDKVENLANYFSESALIRYRVTVEIEYFISLCEIPLPQLSRFDSEHFEQLREIYRNFTLEDAQKIKDIEKVTNHDVKAVEYFI